jgi:flagellar biosynthesis chaperone FliJ
MAINSRIARSIRDVRAKLRDLAAAEHSTAASRTASAAAHVDDETARLEDTIDDAEDQLASATNVYQLDDIHGTVASQREAIVAAVATHTAATEISELSAARLRARTRQLKTSEKVVELVHHQRARRESKVDQRRNDDLATTATRRK